MGEGGGMIIMGHRRIEIIIICSQGKLHQERDNLMQQQRNAGSNAAALTGQTCKVNKYRK